MFAAAVGVLRQDSGRPGSQARHQPFG